MGPEAKVKDAVKKLCRTKEVYYHMPVQNGMGKPTLDFILCAFGEFIGVETKAPGKTATPRQRLTMAEMEASGGKTIVIDSVEDVVRLNLLIESCRKGI